MAAQPSTLGGLRRAAVNLRQDIRQSTPWPREEIDVPEASTADGVVSVRRDLALLSPRSTVRQWFRGDAPRRRRWSFVSSVSTTGSSSGCIDLVGSLLCLVILLPIIAGVALAVRLMLGPNIFFCQERVGRNGKTFRMIKFRSMQHDRRSDNRRLRRQRSPADTQEPQRSAPHAGWAASSASGASTSCRNCSTSSKAT